MAGRGTKPVRLAVLALVLLFCCSLLPSAFAAVAEPILLGHRVTEDALLLYVKGVSLDAAVQAQIGQDLADGVSVAAGSEIPIVTWLILDNSSSISEADQGKLRELAAELVAGRAHDEKFVLATADETLHVLSPETDSYNDLKTLIGEIPFADQNSYLYDALDEVLRQEQSRKEPAFVRIAVFSDGGDDNPSGMTGEEVLDAFASAGIPVYVMGCETEGLEQALKHLYAVSRVSGGSNWSLTQTENVLDVVQALSGEELPVCITVPIPAVLQDGSVKGVQVSFDGLSSISLQANMPFGAPQLPAETAQPEMSETEEPTPAVSLAPTAEPAEAPEATEAPETAKPTETPAIVEPADTVQKSSPLPFVAVGVAVALVLVVLVLVLVKVLGQKRRNLPPDLPPVAPPAPAPVRPEETQVVPGSETNLDESSTTPIGSGSRRYMLQLQDIERPEHRYEVPLLGRVSVGRSSSNRVVLDYEPTVSGKHCEIYQEGNAFLICDLGSRNHTYVDGERVEDTAEIISGCEISLGRAKLHVEIR